MPIGILRNPSKLSEIYGWNLKAAVRLYNVIHDFSKKSTRKYLRRLVSRVVRERFGLNMSADLVVKTKFDDRIKLVEIRKTINDCITSSKLPDGFRNRARKKVKIVQTKNLTIGDLLHNQRAYAAREVLTCQCAGMPYPRVGGHVRFRFREGDDRHVRLANANDIPRAALTDRVTLLRQEVNDSFANWCNFRGEPPVVSTDSLASCITISNDVSERLKLGEVDAVKKELKGLVLTPLDRNPGETLAMCPVVYHQAMMHTFVRSPGYRVMGTPEKIVHKEIWEDLVEMGLKGFVKWDRKGEFGKSYVLPKHKDLDRYCPICPTYNEPMVKTGKLVAKALNHLLFSLPKDSHFNMQAVEHMAQRLGRINKILASSDNMGRVEVMSYDIKEMFSKLTHDQIMKALEWIVLFHQEKGRTFVRVNPRGRGCSFGMTTGGDGWRRLDLKLMMKFVQLELRHTYTYATGLLLRQDIGIPMGKSTSPPLACILCAYAEHNFIRRLGRWRQRVFGLRLMDDVTLILGSLPGDIKEDIRSNFENCYPKNLVLKRTDEGRGKLDFLGWEIQVAKHPPCLGSIQQSRNEQSLWMEEKLVIQNGQTFKSWGSRQQKSAIVGGYLHQIDRNTTIRAAIPRRVLTVKKELRIKGFDAELFNRVLKRYARNRGKIRELTVELLTK
ncbi:hypothetical protein CBR_g3831 [Chara braunii]|uniref:Reverse transcriptase domain-containing protein n=1 Tax=Chara braunii TaxID=69332 RepID=A0A388KGF4_CHABU|nr:hypothetical protein CBR_g3831 [Chara braunii]|eukprot:GBG69132.1 hypothetical protein CBR_g3831 [Chara braunii]